MEELKQSEKNFSPPRITHFQVSLQLSEMTHPKSKPIECYMQCIQVRIWTG